MAKTKYLLSKIKIGDILQDVIAKTTGEYVTVAYKGADVSLTTALSGIIADISNLPLDTTIDEKISAAIDELIGGAPETYDTLKEIADYIAAHEDIATALNDAIGKKADKEVVEGIQTSLTNLEETVSTLKTKVEAMPTITDEDIAAWNNKVDKITGKGLSTNDFTDEDKAKLDGLTNVTEEEKAVWNAKADKTVATASVDGLMSAEDKARLNGLNNIYCSASQPTDMQNGDVWIQIFEE
ncbi:MAG: hypothetical protein NC452_15200 [Eubacterium sp.]|nr:hypothetical protein [Eubacterium sp.]